jgi:hypothetical protein
MITRQQPSGGAFSTNHLRGRQTPQSSQRQEWRDQAPRNLGGSHFDRRKGLGQRSPRDTDLMASHRGGRAPDEWG